MTIYNSYPLTSIDRDELEQWGYDVDQISDEEIEGLANRMGQAYRESVFEIDLKVIADEVLCLPRK